MTLLACERAALDELGDWLRSRFADRLSHLILFGSRARGEGSEDSDLDVLVAVADLSGGEARQVWQYAGDLLTRHDVLVSLLVMPSARFAELRDRERLIASEIERDGIRL